MHSYIQLDSLDIKSGAINGTLEAQLRLKYDIQTAADLWSKCLHQQTYKLAMLRMNF